MLSRRSFVNRVLGALGVAAVAPVILPLVEKQGEAIEGKLLETAVDFPNLPDYSIATMHRDSEIVNQMMIIHSEHSFQKGDLVVFDENGAAVRGKWSHNPRFIGIAVSEDAIQIQGVYHG